jgi:hypothetical protein
MNVRFNDHQVQRVAGCVSDLNAELLRLLFVGAVG